MKKIICFFFSCLIGYSLLSAQTKLNRPNIVIIISDDHAYQTISAYGSNLMQTPNIDRLARDGMICNKAYVTNSICGPSRAVFLTGKYSHENGFKDNETSHFDAGQNLFVKELRNSGYQTAWIGKYHLGEKPQGFDFWEIFPGQGHYYNPDVIMMDGSTKRIEGYAPNIVEDLSEDWLDRRDPDKPFCLIIGHKSTHRTWIPDTCDLGMFDDKTFPLPDNFYDDYEGRAAAKVQDMTIARTMLPDYDLKMSAPGHPEPTVDRMNTAQRERFDAYYQPIFEDFKARALSGNALTEWKYQRYLKDYLSTAASLDRNIGRTLDYLDKHHLTDNTLVMYLSDQGFYMGEHGWFDKRFMYEESFRTPMLIRYPGKITPGSSLNEYVLNLDIAPTVLAAAGVGIPKDMQGENILPLLTGTKKTGRKAMYYHYYENGEHSVSPHFGIQTKDFKLIRFYKRVNAWELYDIHADPKDMHNLYHEEGYKHIIKRLKSQLRSLIKKYKDEDALRLMDLP